MTLLLCFKMNNVFERDIEQLRRQFNERIEAMLTNFDDPTVNDGEREGETRACECRGSRTECSLF